MWVCKLAALDPVRFDPPPASSPTDFTNEDCQALLAALPDRGAAEADYVASANIRGDRAMSIEVWIFSGQRPKDDQLRAWLASDGFPPHRRPTRWQAAVCQEVTIAT
jgi:hypothetical protein